MRGVKPAVYLAVVLVVLSLSRPGDSGEPAPVTNRVRTLGARVKMLESAVKSKDRQVQALQLENVKLLKEVARLRRLCLSAGIASEPPASQPSEAPRVKQPSTAPFPKKTMEPRPSFGRVTVKRQAEVVFRGTLSQLLSRCKADYQTNQIKFVKDWYGATVVATGRLADVADLHAPYVKLAMHRNIIWCSFGPGAAVTSREKAEVKRVKETLAKLRKGQIVTIRGNFAPPPLYEKGLSRCVLVLPPR